MDPTPDVPLDPVPGGIPPLEAGTAHAWWVSLDVAPGRVRIAADCLSDEERARAARFRSGTHRRQWTVARSVLRRILGHYTDLGPAAVTLTAGHRGKPRLAPGAAPLDLRFNLSHAGERAVVAVALGTEVGVDVERLDRRVDALAVARRYFPAEEHERLAGLPPPARAAAFLRLWTACEAWAKAEGEGIAGVLDDPARTGVLARAARAAESTDGVGDTGAGAPRFLACGWAFHRLSAEDGYVATLATRPGIGAVRAGRWETGP